MQYGRLGLGSVGGSIFPWFSVVWYLIVFEHVFTEFLP